LFILVAMLLSLKPQFRAFAGGLTQQVVRSAIMLALLGFVICPSYRCAAGKE
jgi:uncharacterized membrane protein (DUF4010 family)